MLSERHQKFRAITFPKWKKMIKEIFGEFVPCRAEWQEIGDIIGILEIIGRYQRKYDNLNHLFFPNGGGLDLTRAIISIESNCIELSFKESVYICKPKLLSFYSFDSEPDWMYFRLDCGKLFPSGIYETMEETICEELLEVMPGIYDHLSYWSYGYYNYGEGEEPLRKGARPITRILQGSMVIFCKASLYNLIRRNEFDAYNAIHNKMSREEFKTFIEDVAKRFQNNQIDDKLDKLLYAIIVRCERCGQKIGEYVSSSLPKEVQPLLKCCNRSLNRVFTIESSKVVSKLNDKEHREQIEMWAEDFYLDQGEILDKKFWDFFTPWDGVEMFLRKEGVEIVFVETVATLENQN